MYGYLVIFLYWSIWLHIYNILFLGLKLKGVADAAKNYHVVLEENRRLYNEVQELKGKTLWVNVLCLHSTIQDMTLFLSCIYFLGNIRVYCRIRPFLPGQNNKQTSIEYIGENGELVVANPFKQGKDTHRLFKFNKVFGQASTQGLNLFLLMYID